MTMLRLLTGLLAGLAFAGLTFAGQAASPDLAGGLRASPPQPIQPLPAQPVPTQQLPLQAPPVMQPQIPAIVTPMPAPQVFTQTPSAPVQAPPSVQSAPELGQSGPQSIAPAPSVKPSPPQSGFINHATTPIGEVHFRGGSLVQSQEQFGRWFETRRDGTINYEFFETGSGPDMIELTGPQGQVRLYVDLKDKVVRGQWPGQTLKTIYTITKVTPLAMVSPNPPTVPQPPIITPVPNPTVPLPKELHVATFANGQFLRMTQNTWRETTTRGEVFDYNVIGLDDVRLYLYDNARGAFVTLEPSTLRSTIAVGGEYLQAYRNLTAVSANIATPIPPRPGVLSASERLACEREGGVVERAGMLGAERCTRAFSDAGQVCSDSAQCQGQCRIPLNVAPGTPTTGVCQANDNPFGCFAEVVAGVAGAGLCVD